MADMTVGTCGRCGGPMRQPQSMCIVGPYPSPKCARCGYEHHGPVMGAKSEDFRDHPRESQQEYFGLN